MKATGIVRRIDELGRVVIPKEIRRTLRVREGYPLEIFVGNDGEIVLKKYSPIGEIGPCAGDCVEALHRVSGHTAFITDAEVVVAAAGAAARRELLDKRLTQQMQTLMAQRRLQVLQEPIPAIVEGGQEALFSAAVLAPILSEGELIGMVMLGCRQGTAGDVEQKLTEAAAAFFAKQMEN